MPIFFLGLANLKIYNLVSLRWVFIYFSKYLINEFSVWKREKRTRVCTVLHQRSPNSKSVASVHLPWIQSFSGFHMKTKEPSLLHYRENRWIHVFPQGIIAQSETRSLVQNLNFSHRFYETITVTLSAPPISLDIIQFLLESSLPPRHSSFPHSLKHT